MPVTDKKHKKAYINSLTVVVIEVVVV